MPGAEVPGLVSLSPSEGDYVDSCLGDLISILRLPKWLKGLLAFMLRPLVRMQGVAGLGWAAPEPLGLFLLPLAACSWFGQVWPLPPSPHPDCPHHHPPPCPVVLNPPAR